MLQGRAAMISVKILYGIWTVMWASVYLIYGSAAAAVVAVLSVVYALLAFIMVRVSGRHMIMALKCAGSAEKGQSLKVHIEAANGSVLPVIRFSTVLKAGNLLTGEQRELPIVFSLGRRGLVIKEPELEDCRCGAEEMKISGGTITDGIRLFHRKIDIEVKASAVILPTIEKLDIPGELLNSYNMESYVYSQHKKGGDPGEVFGIREYADGDSPKAIHWKLSAKAGEMMVKIPSFPIENNIAVILDNSSPDGETPDPDGRSRLMDMFFSISFTLLEENIGHTIAWYDADNASFEFREIADKESLWRVMPETLRAGFTRGQASTPYRFVEFMEDRIFTNHFLVTAGDDRDIGLLERYGEVKVFRSR